MGLLERIKNIFSEKKKKIEIKKISLENLNAELESQLNIIRTQISDLQKQIHIFLTELISKLKDKKEDITKIDLDKRKEDIKIKHLVRENIGHYLSYTEKLIQNLENLNLDENYLHRLEKIFSSFDKNSKMAFEKATILVGKEIGDIRDAIKGFQINLSNILNENKQVFDNKLKIEELISLVSSLEAENKNKSGIELSLENLNKKLADIEIERDKANGEIHKIQSSSEFSIVDKEKQEKNKRKKELEQEILKIKEKTDLKFMAKFFHEDKKKSEIVKNYSENFIQAMKEDSNLEIINLAKEAGKDIEDLRRIKSEIESLETIPVSDIEISLLEAEREKSRISSSLRTALEEIEKEKDKVERFNEKLENLEKEIKEKALPLGIEID